MENVRLTARLWDGQLDDPDVDKKIVNESNSVQPKIKVHAKVRHNELNNLKLLVLLIASEVHPDLFENTEIEHRVVMKGKVNKLLVTLEYDWIA